MQHQELLAQQRIVVRSGPRRQNRPISEDWQGLGMHAIQVLARSRALDGNMAQLVLVAHSILVRTIPPLALC